MKTAATMDRTVVIEMVDVVAELQRSPLQKHTEASTPATDCLAHLLSTPEVGAQSRWTAEIDKKMQRPYQINF